MPIVPDDRNWTFVLDEVCSECNFDTQGFPRETLGALIRANAATWPELLAHHRAGERPNDHTWSALEYGCHVRDVFRLYHFRLGLMLDNDGPSFPNWDQDETAIAERYDEQGPAAVTAELVSDGNSLADLFDTVSGEQWQRTGFRSDGVAFTIESFGRYFLHDPEHHVHDVSTGYRELDHHPNL
jgi:hypothetical protein